MTIHVVIADDHPIFRDGLRALFATTDDIDLVGEAADGAGAIDVVATTVPDVVVMDLQMPGLNGVEATRRLATLAPTARVIVLTMFEDDGAGMAAGRPTGVGTAAMRERASELGGTLDIGPRDGGGTRVLATLPWQA